PRTTQRKAQHATDSLRRSADAVLRDRILALRDARRPPADRPVPSIVVTLWHGRPARVDPVRKNPKSVMAGTAMPRRSISLELLTPTYRSSGGTTSSTATRDGHTSAVSSVRLEVDIITTCHTAVSMAIMMTFSA